MELDDRNQMFKDYVVKWSKEDKPMYHQSLLTVVLTLAYLFLLPFVVYYAGQKLLFEMGLPININYVSAFVLVCIIKCFTLIPLNEKPQSLNEDDFRLIIRNVNEKLKNRLELFAVTCFLAWALL